MEPKSPADALQWLELERLQRARSQHAAFAYKMPRALMDELNDVSDPSGLGTPGMAGSASSSSLGGRGRPVSAAASRWVHHPLSDLWKLGLNAKGVLEWTELAP